MCVGSWRTDPTHSSPTSWKWVLLVKMIVAHKQLRISLPCTKSYVSFSCARQPTIRFYLDLDKSSAHLLILFLKKTTVISSHHLPLGVTRIIFHSDSLNKITYTLLFHIFPILSSIIIFTLITFGEGCKLWRSSLLFLQPLIDPALLGPNILLETLFLNTLLP